MAVRLVPKINAMIGISKQSKVLDVANVPKVFVFDVKADGHIRCRIE
jgi:hypothetical protein